MIAATRWPSIGARGVMVVGMADPALESGDEGGPGRDIGRQ
jgi:hypothetical protein